MRSSGEGLGGTNYPTVYVAHFIALKPLLAVATLSYDAQFTQEAVEMGVARPLHSADFSPFHHRFGRRLRYAKHAPQRSVANVCFPPSLPDAA